MSGGGEMELDHDPAVRAAAGLTDVGGTVDAAANALATVVSALSLGSDAVGVALAARHAGPCDAVAEALPVLAESLRQLDATVQAGAAALVSTDQHGSALVRGAAEGRA